MIKSDMIAFESKDFHLVYKPAMCFHESLDLRLLSGYLLLFYDLNSKCAVAFAKSDAKGEMFQMDDSGFKYYADVPVTGLHLYDAFGKRGFVSIDTDFNPNLIHMICWGWHDLP